jgi:tetratricopeptide (TPR) repeat protein
MPGSNLLAALLIGNAAISGSPPATKLVPNVQTLVQQGYDHFYNLEYSDAITDFQRAVDLDPDDPDLHNHLAEAIVFQEMYRDGALESELISGVNAFIRRPKLNPSPATKKRLLDQITLAIAIGEQRLNKGPDDTTALYALGIAYGLRANYHWGSGSRGAILFGTQLRRAGCTTESLNSNRMTLTRGLSRACTITSWVPCPGSIGSWDSWLESEATNRQAFARSAR